MLKKASIDASNFGYVLGTIDGGILDSHNKNRKFYGASTAKPVMALANLILCNEPGSGRCLTSDELSALLNYSLADDPKKYWHEGDSNKVNRALSAEGWQKGMDDPATFEASKKLARFRNNKEASKFLTSLGLPDMAIRYGGNNYQSPLSYFEFMVFLLNPEVSVREGAIGAARRVLDWMQRKFGINEKDREHKGRFLKHLRYAQKRGLDLNSIYGKGGYYKEANNSAMVLDDKYVLVIYTDSLLSTTRGKSARVNDLSEIIYEILVRNDIGVTELPDMRRIEDRPEDETLEETLMQEDDASSENTSSEPGSDSEDETSDYACKKFNFEIDKSYNRRHRGRKKSKFVITGKKGFQGESEGNFKHYEEKLMDMDLCSFDEFYDAIIECFGPEWSDKVLPDHGMDYYFRDEHERAYIFLKRNEDEGKCPTKTGREPILGADEAEPESAEGCGSFLKEWNEKMIILVNIQFADALLKKENKLREEEGVKAERRRQELPEQEPLDNPRDIILLDDKKAGDRLITKEMWDNRRKTFHEAEKLLAQMKKLKCPQPELSFNPKDITDGIKHRFPAGDDVRPPRIEIEDAYQPRSREELDVRQDAQTPSMNIDFAKNYMVYGYDDPLKRYPSNGLKYPLDEKLKELFGYNSWKSYKQENKEDLTKEVIILRDGKKITGKVPSLESGDRVLSAPTLWPIHVAMSLREFSNSQSAVQYSPTLLLTSSEEKKRIQETINKFNIGVDNNMGALSGESQDILERRLGLVGLGDGYSSTEKSKGALETGTRNPYEKLLEGGQEALSKAFASENRKNSGVVNNQVVDSEGKPLYWINKDPARPDKSFVITSDEEVVSRAKAANSEFGQVLIDSGSETKMFGAIPIKASPIIIRRPADVLPPQHRPELPLGFKAGVDKVPELEINIGTAYYLPKDWNSGDRIGRSLTESEDILFKRLGVKDSKLNEGAHIYRMDLNTKETNVFGVADYGVSEEEDPLLQRQAEWRSERPEARSSEGDSLLGGMTSGDEDADQPVNPTLEYTDDERQEALDTLLNKVGARVWDPDERRAVVEVPEDWRKRTEFKDLAEYYDIMNKEITDLSVSGWEVKNQRPWHKLSYRERTRVIEILEKARSEEEEPYDEAPVKDPTLNIPKDQIEKALGDLTIRSGGKWITHGGRRILQEPAGFDLENPLPAHKDLAYYYNTILDPDPRSAVGDRTWDELARGERERILNILKLGIGKPEEVDAAAGEEAERLGVELADMGPIEDWPREPEKEFEESRPLVPDEGQPEEKIDESLGLVKFKGFGKTRPANQAVSYAQPSVINFLKDLSRVNDGNWRIGDISLPDGRSMGDAAAYDDQKYAVHGSHKTGLDVDIAIPLSDGGSTIFTKEENPERYEKNAKSKRRPWVKNRGWDYMPAELDSSEYSDQIKKIIDLITTAVDHGAIYIFVDGSIIRSIKEVVKLAISQTGAYGGVIGLDEKYKVIITDNILRHEEGHKDHFHIRFPLNKEVCPGPGARCAGMYNRFWRDPKDMKAFKSRGTKEFKVDKSGEIAADGPGLVENKLDLNEILNLINEVARGSK